MIWTILKFALIIIGGYLLGNFSFARISSKKQNNDITKLGSGNPGTMNMLRNFGFVSGLLTLIADAVKGVIPSLVGFLIFGGTDGGSLAYIALYAGGLFVVLGHNFPVFYGFKGGKGVACMLGMFLVADPILTLIMIGVVFIYLLIFDYASFGSFILITVLTISEAIRFTNFPYTDAYSEIIIKSLLAILYFLCWFMHRKNIYRLLTGKENKVNLMRAIKKLGKKTKLTKKEEKKKDIG